MCSIIGIKGQFAKKHAINMLKILNHRGPDAKGIFSNNIIKHDNIEEIPESEFVLAHNLLSIVGENEIQPLQMDNLTLIANAEIYNYNNLIQKYDIKDLNTKSDCEIILKIIKKEYKGNLEEAVLKMLPLLDGDYAFCITDNEDFMVIRDKVGVKPVYYTSNEHTFAFASEQKALQEINHNVNTLKPTQAIFNNQIITIRDEYERKPEKISYESLKEELKTNITNAVNKRIRNLDKVALLFSAGVDSTLIAELLKKAGIDTTLYTIGTENSQDMKFAKQAAQELGLPLKYEVINREIVEENFLKTIEIIEDTNLMKVGVGMTIYLTSKLAKKDNQKVILSGQGADELFAGYNRYKNKYNQPEELTRELTYDLNNMYHVNLERDDKATMANSMELRVPYLDKHVIKTASKVPTGYMLKSDNDNLRKHILRDAAYELGVPEYIAYRPKKAAQYGTGIDKIIRKKIIKKEQYKTFLENYEC